ncbi:hypothetical protein ACOKW7_00565 [Limnospira platensis CENA597]|uniref:hypothetical protein n=1 Tax=Limnospira platensis TaxID=118562 RepID=UPI003DA173FB
MRHWENGKARLHLQDFNGSKPRPGKILKIADLVDDDPSKRDKVAAALKDPTHKDNRDRVDIIIAPLMAKEGFDWIGTTRFNHWLPFQFDRNCPDYWAGDPRRTGSNPRPVYQLDCGT